MSLPAADQRHAARHARTARRYARWANRLSPLTGVLTVLTAAAAIVVLLGIFPDSRLAGAAAGLAVVAAVLGLGGVLGPLRGRRRWLLEIAEEAAAAHLRLRVGRPYPPALAAWQPDPTAGPDLDATLDTMLKLDGAAPFLLRPGERAWLRATAALLIQAGRES